MPGPFPPDVVSPAAGAPVALAVVILAHTDPTHVRRLISALDPFPVFLHCDASTPEPEFQAMTTGLPTRCRVLPRMSTGWAKWENVAAELAGYRAALAETDATHVALLTGTDYPLASSAEISATLRRYPGTSLAVFESLPTEIWGQGGGLDRLRYRHWVYRKHMIRLPIPRPLPAGITLAGGSQLKVLAREHAAAVLDVADSRPDLVRYWKRSWVADETFVPSILSTPAFVPDWPVRHIRSALWWIGWDGRRRKSPPWLDLGHRDVLLGAADQHAQSPVLFARKFSTRVSSPLLDEIDTAKRNRSLPEAPTPAASIGVTATLSSGSGDPA